MVDPQGRKKSPIIWTPEAEEAFIKIREAISKCLLLHFLDDHSSIALYTDASDYGVGGILIQIVDNVQKPI